MVETAEGEPYPEHAEEKWVVLWSAKMDEAPIPW